jgi:hypothetical protein
LADGLRERSLLVGTLALGGVGHYVSGPVLETALDAELDAYRRVLKNASVPS